MVEIQPLLGKRSSCPSRSYFYWRLQPRTILASQLASLSTAWTLETVPTGLQIRGGPKTFEKSTNWGVTFLHKQPRSNEACVSDLGGVDT